jgi:hypothetical protein
MWAAKERLGEAVRSRASPLASRSSSAKLFSKEEARRIAANVAKLPELLKKEVK